MEAELVQIRPGTVHILRDGLTVEELLAWAVQVPDLASFADDGGGQVMLGMENVTARLVRAENDEAPTGDAGASIE